MTNIAKFYQTETHDYENFFKNYESSSKEKELNSLIKGLNEQLENAKVELSRVQNESYNKDFTPNGKTIIVHYASNRSDLSLYFDLLSGNAVDINDYNMKEVLLKEVNLKGGEFWVIVSRLELLFLATTNTESLQIISLVLSFLSMKVYFQSLIKTLPLSVNLENLVSSLGEIVPQALLLNFMTFLKNKSEFIIILLNSNLLQKETHLRRLFFEPPQRKSKEAYSTVKLQKPFLYTRFSI